MHAAKFGHIPYDACVVAEARFGLGIVLLTLFNAVIDVAFSVIRQPSDF